MGQAVMSNKIGNGNYKNTINPGEIYPPPKFHVRGCKLRPYFTPICSFFTTGQAPIRSFFTTGQAGQAPSYWLLITLYSFSGRWVLEIDK